MKNETSNLPENLTNEIDEIIKNAAIDAANVEKLGAVFLSFGYSTFIQASNIDILESLDTNNTGTTAFTGLVFGQKFILLGYILLYIAATKKLNGKTFANIHGDERNDLLAFETLKNGYLGDVLLSYTRLIQFIKIQQEESKKEDSSS